MKRNFIRFLYVLFPSFIFCQADILSSGGDATGVNGTESFSVGQIYFSVPSGNGDHTIIGVQQPFEINTLGIDELPKITLQFAVYPIPTNSNLTINVKEEKYIGSQYSMYDYSGKLIVNGKVNDIETNISTSTLQPATYILVVKTKSNETKTFRIIKN